METKTKTEDHKKVEKVEDEAMEAAKAARIAMVKEEIRLAQEKREKNEKETGLAETPGAKADREAEEAKKLEWANETRFIELIEGSGGSELINTIIARLNDVISYVNHHGDRTYRDYRRTMRKFDSGAMKPTDTVKYSETGNV